MDATATAPFLRFFSDLKDPRRHNVRHVFTDDRFARKVLGMDGAALLQAWMPVLLEWMAELDIADVPADEGMAKAAEEAINAIWRKVVA